MIFNNQLKFLQIYTKTFGGKIWSNLHKVSLDNIFDKKVKRLPLNFSAKIDANITLCKIFGHENFETASRKRWRLFSPCSLSLNFFCTKWYTLYSYNEQQGKLFFLCTANWCVSNLIFLLKNDKYSLPCCYKKYIFQPYLFLCCWSVFVKNELMCWSQNNLEPFSSLLVAKTQTIREFLESNFFSSVIWIPISKFPTLLSH